MMIYVLSYCYSDYDGFSSNVICCYLEKDNADLTLLEAEDIQKYFTEFQTKRNQYHCIWMISNPAPVYPSQIKINKNKNELEKKLRAENMKYNELHKNAMDKFEEENFHPPHPETYEIIKEHIGSDISFEITETVLYDDSRRSIELKRDTEMFERLKAK